FAMLADRRYTSRMIIRARTVVTMDEPPIENGAVVVSRNRIDDSPSGSSSSRAARLCRAAPAGSVVDVGRFDELKTRNAGQIVDLGEQALLPGLINAHCHLDYTCLRGKIPPQKTFTNWIGAINAEKARLSPKDYLSSINEGCEEIARRENVLLTTHLAESREEMEMFRDSSGPLYEFLKGIGRPMDDCGNKTPLERFLDLIGRGGSPNRPQAIEVNRPYLPWIIAHLNELTESDFELLENAKGQFHVVHCPRSHGYFKHSHFPFKRLDSLGFNVCLGTDSLASNENLSLFAEMRVFQRSEPGISPEEILKMATVNPAMALHQENMIGRIHPGFCADLI